MSQSKDPLFTLPKDLQDERRNLVAEQRDIEARLRDIDREIEMRRSKCAHRRPDNLTGYEYTVYCTECGKMIDSWL
ncbi:MAG: hypothetical protein AB7L09_02540 [Nitrospira sp.]